jgi:hypothetical protein
MPPTEEMIRKAIECLGGTNLVRFSADKTSVRAGEAVTISWDVDVPSTCGLSVRLNFAQVPKSGSRVIHPVRPVSYRLDAGASSVSKLLGVVNIDVDSSNCSLIEIPEDLVRPGVLQSVDEEIAAYNADPDNSGRKASKRRETVFEIEPDGLVVKLRLKIALNNFFDPDVDVDAKIAVGVSPEGKPLAFYRSFSVDVDWPWWVTGITLGISKIVEEFADGLVEGQLKTRILEGLKEDLEARVGRLGTVGSVETAQDKILATVCSSSGGSMVGHIVNPFEGVLVDVR